MGGVFDAREYRPAGPTVKAFHESNAFTRMMAGPIGSAKTTAAAVAEAFFCGMLQRPDSQGVRHAKVGILRDTYRNLYSTLIPTWFRWVPREFGHFTGSDDRPASHELEIMAPFTDGTPGMGPVRLRVEMRALGPNTVEAVCRGWELTGCYLDEADLFPEEAVSFLAGRVMRYPDKAQRVTRGVWGTFNKPDVDHWLYRKCVEEEQRHYEDDFEFFDQPGGLLPGQPYRVNPAAENLENLDADYYIKAAKGQQTWYVRRMLRNEWGASVSGDLVFPEFQPALHVSPVQLMPAPRTVLSLGIDGGGTPAAVIGGRDEYGRRVIYDEVVLTDPSDPRGRRLLHGVGPKRFAEAVGDLILPKYDKCFFQIAHADPAMFFGADREMGEYADIETIGQLLKIPVQPAPSNEIALRLEAVRSGLTTLAFDGRPMKIYNPSCQWLRRGYTSDYKWQERDPKQPGARLKPQKTATSHVCDADQYYSLGDMGRAGVTAGPKFDRGKPKEEAHLPASYRQAKVEWAKAQPASGGGSYRSDFDPW